MAWQWNLAVSTGAIFISSRLQIQWSPRGGQDSGMSVAFCPFSRLPGEVEACSVESLACQRRGQRKKECLVGKIHSWAGECALANYARILKYFDVWTSVWEQRQYPGTESRSHFCSPFVQVSLEVAFNFTLRSSIWTYDGAGLRGGCLWLFCSCLNLAALACFCRGAVLSRFRVQSWKPPLPTPPLS